MDLLASALVVIGLLIAGNLFCMACPFTLPRDLARKFATPLFRWPRQLRAKWIAVGLLITYLWAYEALGLWNSPRSTAWIILGYFVAAFAIDSVLKGASFCKYVCPIGQFHFVHSLVSPLEVKVREPADLHDSCSGYDCIRGNDRQRGCELNLFQPKKSGNFDCTFCLDCVQACPQHNVGILAAPPGRDLARDPFRSSLGRLSRRPDIAALALVLVFSAFVNAAAMLEPIVSTVPITRLSFLCALMLAPVLLVGGATLAGWRFSHGTKPSREIFCRFSLALVPVGVAMWAAHLLFHLSTAWNSAWPVIQRVSIDLGIGWLGTPRWGASSPVLAADTLLACQILLLDLGLLLSLYIGWQIARNCVTRLADRLRLLAPWAAVLSGTSPVRASGYFCSPCKCEAWCTDEDLHDNAGGGPVCCMPRVCGRWSDLFARGFGRIPSHRLCGSGAGPNQSDRYERARSDRQTGVVRSGCKGRPRSEEG